MIDALRKLSALLSMLDIPWATVGGANIGVRCNFYNPKDIDIITSSSGVSIIHEALKEFSKGEPEISECGNIRSNYFKAVIVGFNVEIMGNPSNLIDGKWVENSIWKNSIEIVDVYDFSLPLTSLEYEVKINEALGNKQRVSLVKKCITNTR